MVIRNYIKIVLCILLYFANYNVALSEVEIKMDTTTIKGNTELPKIIYIVPWKESKQYKNKEQLLVIHSLYGDLFDPVLPSN